MMNDPMIEKVHHLLDQKGVTTHPGLQFSETCHSEERSDEESRSPWHKTGFFAPSGRSE